MQRNHPTIHTSKEAITTIFKKTNNKNNNSNNNKDNNTATIAKQFQIMQQQQQQQRRTYQCFPNCAVQSDLTSCSAVGTVNSRDWNSLVFVSAEISIFLFGLTLTHSCALSTLTFSLGHLRCLQLIQHSLFKIFGEFCKKLLLVFLKVIHTYEVLNRLLVALEPVLISALLAAHLTVQPWFAKATRLSCAC